MSKFRHTEGKWEIVKGVLSDSFDSLRIFCNHTYIGSVGNSDASNETNLANARLISCAPEMLDALIEMKKAFDPYGFGGSGYNNHVGAINKCVDIITRASGMTIDEAIKRWEVGK